MRKVAKYLMLIAGILLMSCGTQEAKYVFFFIGDGMGPVQVNAAERYLASVQGKSGIVKLNMNTAEYTGSATTFSKNHYITDSGAAVTALATGNKTNNSTLSMDAEHTKAFKSIAESAKESGKKIGIISTVDIDHATPAGFYAHQPNRGNYYQIGKELATSGFDYFAGGGLRYFTDPKGLDSTNVIDLAKENGYLYVNNKTAFSFLEPGAGKVLFIYPELAEGYSMPYSIDNDDNGISLSDITAKAIDMLDSEEGFFIMVEGGKIDWACHRNDAAATVKDVIAFDEAIEVALEFYKKNPDNTLILITADHECGGMTLGTASADYDLELGKLQWQEKSFAVINAEYAEMKKEKEELMGKDSLMFEADWALEYMFGVTGLGDDIKGLALDSNEVKELTQAYTRSFEERDKYVPSEYILYGPYDPFVIKVTHILSRKAGIGWSTFSHTAIPVPVRAFGVGAEAFNGSFDNTDIYQKLMDIMDM